MGETRSLKLTLAILVTFLVVVIVSIVVVAAIWDSKQPRPYFPVAQVVDGSQLKSQKWWFPVAFVPTDFYIAKNNGSNIYAWTFDFNDNGQLIIQEAFTDGIGQATVNSPIAYNQVTTGSISANVNANVFLASPAKFYSTQFGGNAMWFIKIHTTYDYFICANPSGSHFWILSKTPQMNCNQLSGLLNFIKFNGISLSNFIYPNNILNCT